MNRKSLVLFSGGLDSYLSLLIALEAGYETRALFFDYGQNSSYTELESVNKIVKRFGITLEIMDLTRMDSVFESPYTTGENPEEGEAYNSSVPNRNMLFLTLASSYAQVNGFTDIYTGFYYKDYKKRSKIHSRINDMKEVFVLDQPDQSKEFLDGYKALLKLSSPEVDITIHNCLEDYDKADIFMELNKRGELSFAVSETTSCYGMPELLKAHEWGRGCGYCGSCITRKESFNLMLTFL